MNENKKAPQNRIEVLEKIAKKLEWSRLVYRGSGFSSIFCCPLCGGVYPDDYERHIQKDDVRYFRGHFKECLFKKILLDCNH